MLEKFRRKYIGDRNFYGRYIALALPMIIQNAVTNLVSFLDNIMVTGDKLNKKLYQHHTGYIGNLKEVKYGTLMAEKSDFAMQLAVKGMIPDTTLGRKQLTRCHIYKGADHKHEAQKPVAYEL